MTDSINANVIVSMPSQLFTMARSFKAVANGKIYIGKIDTDPVNPENQIQVYVENEDGSHVPVSQPIIINAAGYPVYNGQIAKFVTVQGHSMAVYDAYGAQQFYFPNVLKYDPEQFKDTLHSASGADNVGYRGYTVSEYLSHTALSFGNLNDCLSHDKYKIGDKVFVHGYNYPSDGGMASFEVVSSDEPVGIKTYDGKFKLKRTSGHNYLELIIKNGATPKIIAHRGWAGITPNEYQGALTAPVYFVPENTRASIRFCAERGAFGVEGDTKITLDGVPVIFHDETVDRTTNGTGAVSTFTFLELKALDAGSYVSGIYADEKILNYDEWIRECKRRGVMPFVEWSAPMSVTQADNFLETINKYYGTKPTNVFVYSTYPAVLELLRSKNAYIGLGVIPSYGVAPTTEQLELAYKLGNCGISLSGGIITNAAVVNSVKKYGLLLIYAIANTPARIDNCISAGVDIMITDCYRG